MDSFLLLHVPTPSSNSLTNLCSHASSVCGSFAFCFLNAGLPSPSFCFSHCFVAGVHLKVFHEAPFLDLLVSLPTSPLPLWLLLFLDKGVGTWSRRKGGGGIDIIGCVDRIQGFHNEWNPPRPNSESEGKGKGGSGEKRKRVAEERPSNRKGRREGGGQDLSRPLFLFLFISIHLYFLYFSIYVSF